MNANNRVADFFYELGLLNRFKRSGFDFLGANINQNIASHSFRATLIGYTLASMIDGVDKSKVMMMCLFHDIPETRMGDINKFQSLYTSVDDNKALNDVAKELPIADELTKFVSMFDNDDSIEAVIARDADVLELIISLKEVLDDGNSQAQYWIDTALNRLSHDKSKEIANSIISRRYYDWWQEILSNNK